MPVLRFFLTLFIFICLLAGSSVLVTTIFLMLRFPPLLLAGALGCGLLTITLKHLLRVNNNTTV